MRPKIVNLLVEKCQRPKEKICAKNLKSTHVFWKLVDQSIKTSHGGQELWIHELYKKFNISLNCCKKQLHSLRTALTREVQKENTEGQQAILFADTKNTVDQSRRMIFFESRNFQHRNLLRDKLRATMVIRATALFNLQRNNVAR